MWSVPFCSQMDLILFAAGCGESSKANHCRNFMIVNVRGGSKSARSVSGIFRAGLEPAPTALYEMYQGILPPLVRGPRKRATARVPHTIVLCSRFIFVLMLYFVAIMDATIKCGFEHGFKIIVPEHGNTTFDNEFMSAEESYGYYNNFMWKNRYAECISLGETLERMK